MREWLLLKRPIILSLIMVVELGIVCLQNMSHKDFISALVAVCVLILCVEFLYVCNLKEKNGEQLDCYYNRGNFQGNIMLFALSLVFVGEGIGPYFRFLVDYPIFILVNMFWFHTKVNNRLGVMKKIRDEYGVSGTVSLTIIFTSFYLTTLAAIMALVIYVFFGP